MGGGIHRDDHGGGYVGGDGCEELPLQLGCGECTPCADPPGECRPVNLDSESSFATKHPGPLLLCMSRRRPIVPVHTDTARVAVTTTTELRQESFW